MSTRSSSTGTSACAAAPNCWPVGSAAAGATASRGPSPARPSRAVLSPSVRAPASAPTADRSLSCDASLRSRVHSSTVPASNWTPRVPSPTHADRSYPSARLDAAAIAYGERRRRADGDRVADVVRARPLVLAGVTGAGADALQCRRQGRWLGAEMDDLAA